MNSISLSLILGPLFFLFVSLVSCSHISYQIHSYNDLRQWPSLLLKGSSWFKFDGHHMTPSFCLENATATERIDKQNTLGCLVLNHDVPSLNRTSPYNTTDDIIQFITAPQYFRYFSSPSRRIYIALCFKYNDFLDGNNNSDDDDDDDDNNNNKNISLVGAANPCDGSGLALNFTELVTRFVNEFKKRVDEKKLNVELILDGAATPTVGSECLSDLWRPYVATYIALSDPMEAAFSNDSTLGYDRFQVNNMQELTLDFVKNVYKYGKFVNSSYPYLLWEPSSQSSLQLSLSSFLSSPSPLHPEFRFAINIDPVQFSVYVANQTKTAYNERLNLVLTTSTANGTTPKENPRLVALSKYVLVFAESENVTYLSIYTYSQLFEPLILLSPPAPFNFNSSLSFSPISNCGTTSSPSSLSSSLSSSFDPPFVFISLFDGSLFFYRLLVSDDGVPSLALFSSLTLDVDVVRTRSSFTAVSAIAAAAATATANESESENQYTLIQTYESNNDESDGDGGALSVQLWQWDSASLIFTIIGAPLILTVSSKGESASSDWTSTSLTVLAYSDDKNDIVSSLCETGHSDQDHVFVAGIVFDDSKRNVWMNAICIDKSQGVQHAITTSTIIGPGERPVLRRSSSLVGLSLSSSHCGNSEDINKRSSPGLCDTPFVSTPFILSYALGPASSWLSMLTKRQKLSACDTEIIYGAYDQGTSADMTMITVKQNNNVNDSDSIVFMSLLKGLPELPGGLETQYNDARSLSPSVTSSSSSSSSSLSRRSRSLSPALSLSLSDYLTCGAATPYDGLVLDAFKVEYNINAEEMSEMNDDQTGRD